MKKKPTNHQKHSGLTSTERIVVWVGILLINPIVTFIIALLLWRDKEPQKWSDFMGIMKLLIIVLVALAFFAFMAAFILASVNPQAQIERARQVKMQREATGSYELNIQQQP